MNMPGNFLPLLEVPGYYRRSLGLCYHRTNRLTVSGLKKIGTAKYSRRCHLYLPARYTDLFKLPG
jgi:hypothetical protein